MKYDAEGVRRHDENVVTGFNAQRAKKCDVKDARCPEADGATTINVVAGASKARPWVALNPGTYGTHLHTNKVRNAGP